MRTLLVMVIALLIPLDGTLAQAIRESSKQAEEAPREQWAGEGKANSTDYPKKTQTNPNQGVMSDKEKAEVFAVLAKSAYERFDKLADTSWHLRLAVWTAFGLGAGFILASEKWKPGRIECIFASLITVGLVVTIVCIWGPSTYERSTRWIKVAQYWESAVERTVGARLPDSLRSVSYKPPVPWYKNPVYLSQALVTAFFGLLVVGAIASRTDWRAGQETGRLVNCWPKASLERNQDRGYLQMSSEAIATVIKMMESLPESAQYQVVEYLRDYLAEMQDEAEWENAFKKPQSRLVAAAQQAKQQIAEGKARPLNYDEL